MFFKPHPALAEFVLQFMVTEITCKTQGSPALYPPMPRNCLNFYPADPILTRKHGDAGFSVLPETIFVGPQITRVNIAFGPQHRFVSVIFHPGAVYRLWRIPLTELFDRPFDAALIFGAAVREVNERLRETTGALEMKTTVEEFLLKQRNTAADLLPIDHAMAALINSGGLLSIDTVAAESCLSIRQFERKCRNMTGMSPKLFSRIVRFSKAYRLKERKPAMRWTDIAHTCGYFDQTHFIKDFKVFAGVAPGVLAGEMGKAAHRLQGHLPF